LEGCREAFDPNLLAAASWPIGTYLPEPSPHPLTHYVAPIEIVVPKLSREAAEVGAFGRLDAAITVAPNGHVSDVAITGRGQSNRADLLGAAVRSAASASRFEPAAIRGITVSQVYRHSYFFPPPAHARLTLDKVRVPVGDTVLASAVFSSSVRVRLRAIVSCAAGYVPDPADQSDPTSFFTNGGFFGGNRLREWLGVLEPGKPLVMNAKFASRDCLSDTIQAYCFTDDGMPDMNWEGSGPAIGRTQIGESDVARKACCFIGAPQGKKRPGADMPAPTPCCEVSH
jgi:hypothetical protein